MSHAWVHKHFNKFNNGARMVLGFRSGLVTDSGSANHLGLETEMETGSEMEKETWLDLVMA